MEIVSRSRCSMGPNHGGVLMIGRVAILGACVALAGCQTTGTGSVEGGECKIFERPQFAVKGARQYDQDWVDSQIEGGVGGCHWQRPAPRPASLDTKPGAPKAAAIRAPKHRGLVARFKDRFMPPPAVPVVDPPPVVTVAPTPRDPVDELLNPSGK